MTPIIHKVKKTCENCIHLPVCHKEIAFPEEVEKFRFCGNWVGEVEDITLKCFLNDQLKRCLDYLEHEDMGALTRTIKLIGEVLKPYFG